MNGKRISLQRARRRGFSLLELIVAMIILAMVIGLIVRISGATAQLSAAVLERQRENSTREAFLSFMRQLLTELPGNARINLTFNDKNPGPILSELVIDDADIPLPWVGEDVVNAKAIRFVTKLQRDGYLNIVMECYDESIISSLNTQTQLPNPFATITLIKGVRYCEWRVQAASAEIDEFQTSWSNDSSLPRQVELMLAFGPNDLPIREVFWIPPKTDPSAFIRTVRSSVRSRNQRAQMPQGDQNSPNGGNPPNGGEGGEGGRPSGGEMGRPPAMENGGNSPNGAGRGQRPSSGGGMNRDR